MERANPSGLRRGILWSLALLVVTVALGLGVYDAVALPGCRSCHARKGFRAATAATVHASIDCRSCHVPKGVSGRVAFALRQPVHMFVPIAATGERDAAAVPDSRCLVCHGAVLERPKTTNGIRIAHESCAAGASCTDCHSATAHGTATSWVRVYDMDRCLACHVSSGRTDCELCHEGRGPSDRIKSRTYAVTHGPEWRTTHGMGDAATCIVCHPANDCIECHGRGVPHAGNFVKVHTGYATGKDARCGSCHASTFCDACHGTPMPHTARFTEGHAKAAADRALCKRCHANSDCTTCHEKHVHPGGAVGGLLPTKGSGR